MTTTPHDDGEPTMGDDNDLTPALRALRDLVGSGGWQSLPGAPNALVYMRPWPDGSVDTLAMLGETEALIERTNPTGQPVWRTNGTVTEVIDTLAGLVAPLAPGAPREPLRSPSRDRDLG
jgi:hypothetical protein